MVEDEIGLFGRFSGSESGKSKGKMDTRSEAQRMKNREAVRNCRKRKKEQARQLMERVEQLERDNAKLRAELQNGRNKRKNGGGENEEELDKDKNLESTLREMEKHFALKGSNAETQLRRDLNLYLEKHQDHGRDRQKAIAFIAHGLVRLLQPARVTKMYMHLLSQEDDDFYNETNGLWRKACKELGLNEDQENELKKRRVQAQRIKTELDYSHVKMLSIWKRLCRNKKLADSIAEINDILKPKQLASFTLWVYNNPACKDILNSLWEDLMKKWDVQIKQELEASSVYRSIYRRFQYASARMLPTLFTILDEEERNRTAKLCLHPKISIIDPNNGADLSGVNGVLKYCRMIDHAFLQNKKGNKKVSSITAKETYIKHDEEDSKITGSWRITGNYKGKLRNPMASPESPASSVSFNVVADFAFGDKNCPELITEIVISFDALELMNQLGLANKNLKALPALTELPPPLDQGKNVESKDMEVEEKEGISVIPIAMTSDDPVKCYESYALSLASVFATDVNVVLKKAAEVLDPKCEFHDVYSGLSYVGIEKCCEYIKRLRRVFPTMNVTPRVASRVLLPPSNKFKDKEMYRIECKWNVKAVYNGKLLSGGLESDKECEYEGITHTESSPLTGKIIRADLILVAQDLMHQLGILK